ncbi:MAG: nucleotidyltransferase family protein [Kiloniellales bacterium]
MSTQADQLLALIAADHWRMTCLQAVAALGLPDGWISAGFVRAALWDHLHGHATPMPLNDIDVIYFEPDDLDPATDVVLEARLSERLPGPPWQVRNQARMHLRNGDAPYRSIEDALCHWLETPTAVAARLGDHGMLELLAPLGLDDLFTMTVRPTPHARARRLADYRARQAEKDWTARWPKVRVL